MPTLIDEAKPLGPQFSTALDLGSNNRPLSLRHDQIANRCHLVQLRANVPTEESRAWLAQHADALLPPELHETIARTPSLAAQASLVVLALPPERQIEFLRGLLPPATLAAAAAAPNASNIATMAHAIVEGGKSDPALQATLASCLMTKEACETLGAKGTVPQLANASRAVSLQEDDATKERLMGTLLIEVRPARAPEEIVSNAHLAVGAMLITNPADRSNVVARYLSDETCDEVALRGDHIQVGSLALTASFLQEPKRLNEIADRLLTDRALDTLVYAATSGLPRGHQAIGRAAKLVDAMPDGDLQTALADRLATTEVCESLETSGNSRAIGRMSMAAMAVSHVDQLTQAMSALSSDVACKTLIEQPDAVAISSVLYALRYWNNQDGSKGSAAADRLLQGAPLKALCDWPEPRDALNALPAVALLPDPDRRHATLAQLMHPEMIAAVSKGEGDFIAWAAYFAPQMHSGPNRDTVLRELLTPENCEKVLTFGDEEIQAFKDAAALLPAGAQRQQVLSIMNGEAVPQWQALEAAQRTPQPRSRGAAAGAEP